MVSVGALLLIGSSSQYDVSDSRTSSEATLPPTGVFVANAKSESSEKSGGESDEEETALDDLKSRSSSSSSQSQSENQNKTRQFKRQLIDTSIEEVPPAHTVQAAAGDSKMKSPVYVEREAKLSAPLKTLIQAPQIYDSSKGGTSELANAFAAASKEGAKSRDDLLFIVENGSPAGRIYAAVLIKNFDVPLGNKILNGFKNEKTLVNNKSYTSLEHFTMGEVVTDLLSPAPAIILKPR